MVAPPRTAWASRTHDDTSAALPRSVGTIRRRCAAIPTRLCRPASAEARERSSSPRLDSYRARCRLQVRAGYMTRRDQASQWLLWFSVLTAATFGLFLLRAQLDKAHFALIFLLVVLGGSAAGGRVLGITLAATAFLVFDFGFLPPYNALVVADPFDWIVLVV